MRLRALHKDTELADSEKTLEHVAQLIDKVLEREKNPLPKKRGRKPGSDDMWLCFHMVGVVPFSSNNRLPRHSQIKEEGRAGKMSEGGFVTIGELLNIKHETVKSNFYKALKRWKSLDGRQEYIEWLNRREKIWEAHQARLEKREPTPREYVLSAAINSMICSRSDDEGEPRIVPLSSEDVDSLVKEADERLKLKSGQNDYENWRLYCNRLLYIPAIYLPSKAGRKRQNV